LSLLIPSLICAIQRDLREKYIDFPLITQIIADVPNAGMLVINAVCNKIIHRLCAVIKQGYVYKFELS
jgi:hypothetical protein